MNNMTINCPVDFCDSDATVCRIRFPTEADSKKQGKLGLDAGAPGEALY